MADPALRVLLVDDDEDEYVIVGDLLRTACADRFELTWASTYERGLESILASRCDVCLVDYRLGQRSGLDLLAEVTAKPGHPPVILLTGEGDRGLDVTATKAGAADYLVKGELTAVLLERSIRYAVERERTLKILRETSELAQSSNLAKSAFLATMSHEIRTPMNAILGMADMLWESPLNPVQMQYVEVVRRAGSDLLQLINDILDLSKIEAGRLELERAVFDLEDVVDQAIQLTAVKARAKGLGLLAHLSPDVATSSMGDSARLKQVLINLLGNAVKFTDSGDIMLTVRNCESGRSGQVEFAVSDTGIGIPAEKLGAIFEDFTQADASTTRKYGGTGLGLGICQRIVEAMGGHLSATSSVGKGSTFRFTVQFDPAPATPVKARIAPGDLHSKRALLIDDNATNCLILRETLHAWGLDSDTFWSPAEALAALPQAMAGEKPYSLVFVDSRMPGMDGFQAAAEIRRIAPGLPIVMLTSDARPGDSARRVEAGLSGYAVKPVARAQLLRLVCDALETREGPESQASEHIEPEAREPVRPARILVAEDSPDNRLLVEVYLKDSPYALTFESDGKAAVDRFGKGDFDLILMDVRMPIMDGLAATCAIRKIERERGGLPIPIIALTADASLTDIEMSGSAGCSAHLSKPISKVELQSAIEKYRRPPTPLETAQSRPHDVITIEMPPGLEHIVPRYLANRKKEIAEMIERLAASDFGRLAVLGHDLKGSGGGYGFPDLTRFGAALEKAAIQRDAGSLHAQVIDLGNYLDRIQIVARMN